MSPPSTRPGSLSAAPPEYRCRGPSPAPPPPRRAGREGPTAVVREWAPAPRAPGGRTRLRRSRPPRCPARNERRPCRTRPGARLGDGSQRAVACRDDPHWKERVERGHRPVREVGCRQRLGRDPAGLRQLERDLACRRELDPAPDDEHAADERERCCERRNGPLEILEGPFLQLGGPAETVDRSPVRARRPGRRGGQAPPAGSCRSSSREPRAPSRPRAGRRGSPLFRGRIQGRS